MDKENVVYTQNGIVFGLKNEGNSAICTNMNEVGGHYAKWNKPVTEGQILYDSTYIKKSKIVKLIETESRMVVARAWGGGEMRNCYSTGIKFQLYKMNKF